jgi:hypothetical protein
MKLIPRRAILLALGVIASMGSARRAAAAAAVGKLLDENEPAAKAIGYVANARMVDEKANPGFKRSQTCATCAFIKFGTGRQRACSAVGDRLVESAGWCKIWKLRGSK